MTKQTALDFADLRYLEITCPGCEARITIDARSKKSRVPASCSGCGAAFDHISVQAPIAQFVDAYKALAHQEQKFRFRVIVDDPAD